MQMCPFCDKVYDESEYSHCPYCSGELVEYDEEIRPCQNVVVVCTGMAMNGFVPTVIILKKIKCNNKILNLFDPNSHNHRLSRWLAQPYKGMLLAGLKAHRKICQPQAVSSYR